MQTSLTPREVEVLRLVAHGYTNAEIAAIMGIHEHVVSNYVHHIMNKLGISRRMRLAIYALKTGLIRLDDIQL